MFVLAKLKFDLRDADETYFAEREIESLLNTKTLRVRTIASLLKEEPFRLLDDEVVHIMTRLTYLGEVQGFVSEIDGINLLDVAKCATFFREIYAIFRSEEKEIREMLKKGGIEEIRQSLVEGKNTVNPYIQIFVQSITSTEKLVTVRIIPFQTLFEYVTEVKKLPEAVFRPKASENWEEYFEEKEKGIDNGVNQLLLHLQNGHYRSPHFGLGKEHIGDFVDWASTDLRKPFLHYLHKYKGKGDPRISRALINLLRVKEGDTILDPFVGSGAFIADAPTMGINAIGIEILGIGQLIAEVKTNLALDMKKLRNEIVRIFERLEKVEEFCQNEKLEIERIKEEIKVYAGERNGYKKIEPHLEKVIGIKKMIEDVEDEKIRKFLLVLLSQQIVEYSDKARAWDIVGSFKSYVEDRYLVLYSTQKLAKILGVSLKKGKVSIIKGDSTNMSMLKDASIDGILTSPPYFDALDYIGNNLFPILVLGLKDDLVWDSTVNLYEKRLQVAKCGEILPLYAYEPQHFPPLSKKLINLLKRSKRCQKANVVENYLKMMIASFKECYRVLKKGKYYIMVVSKYHSWTVNGKERVIETSPLIAELGKSAGFTLVEVIQHGLSKADEGKIGVEDILVFQK
ncbi:MAG: hypothetical protein QW620_01865 [Thermoplasmata archaeon]